MVENVYACDLSTPKETNQSLMAVEAEKRQDNIVKSVAYE